MSEFDRNGPPLVHPGHRQDTRCRDRAWCERIERCYQSYLLRPRCTAVPVKAPASKDD